MKTELAKTSEYLLLISDDKQSKFDDNSFVLVVPLNKVVHAKDSHYYRNYLHYECRLIYAYLPFTAESSPLGSLPLLPDINNEDIIYSLAILESEKQWGYDDFRGKEKGVDDERTGQALRGACVGGYEAAVNSTSRIYTKQQLENAIILSIEHGKSIMAYYQLNGHGSAPLTERAFADAHVESLSDNIIPNGFVPEQDNVSFLDDEASQQYAPIFRVRTNENGKHVIIGRYVIDGRSTY